MSTCRRLELGVEILEEVEDLTCGTGRDKVSDCAPGTCERLAGSVFGVGVADLTEAKFGRSRRRCKRRRKTELGGFDRGWERW